MSPQFVRPYCRGCCTHKWNHKQSASWKDRLKIVENQRNIYVSCKRCLSCCALYDSVLFHSFLKLVVRIKNVCSLYQVVLVSFVFHSVIDEL